MSTVVPEEQIVDRDLRRPMDGSPRSGSRLGYCYSKTFFTHFIKSLCIRSKHFRSFGDMAPLPSLLNLVQTILEGGSEVTYISDGA